MSRKTIRWNRRPTSRFDTGEIDEVVFSGVSVHVEEMDENCFWIGIYTDDPDVYWMGNFWSEDGRMKFGQQEDADIPWDEDSTHESPDPAEETP